MLIPSVKTHVTKDPLVSVVIPARDDEVGIARCLGGIARQNLPLEVIVVDDGSSDGTPRVARDAGAVVLDGGGRGAAHARNVGIDAARGSYILFTDADCIPCPGWARALLDPLLDGKAIATKGVYRTQQQECTPQFVQLEYEERYHRMADCPAIDFLDTYSLGVVAAEIRAIGGFDEAFAGASVEDQEMSFRLRSRGRFRFVPEAVVLHRHAATAWTYGRKKFKIGRGKATVARRHRECIQGDSHTPSSLRWQLPAVWGSVVCTLLSPWISGLEVVALLLGLAPIMCSLALLHSCVQRQGVLFLPAAMSLTLLRGWALAVGFAVGVLRPLAVLDDGGVESRISNAGVQSAVVDAEAAATAATSGNSGARRIAALGAATDGESGSELFEGVDEGEGVYHTST